jgi:hypothetical protein
VSPSELIARLGLAPHPEGGHYAETWRDAAADGRRGSGSAIYYLLQPGESSAWHRIDATEVWHFYAGAAVELRCSRDGEEEEVFVLGYDLAAGEEAQRVVPAGVWQAARCLGRRRDDWSLLGCTVSPAFRFEGFELAPAGFTPARRR